MNTSNKLLYIFPDVAYLAELLPTKQEHRFTVQTFRQINGDFIDDNEFIADNVTKLIGKIDPDEYHLVLPDFLFTNTIVEIGETSEAKVKEYLTSKMLPELTLSPQTHELKTFVLTEHGGKSKVQLSALEKSLMNPVSSSAAEKKIKITGVSPLSWTIKSIISLEPSISVIQMGSQVYLAQHYIGVDQAINAPADDISSLNEAIKTLKGAEPSIQTVYIISNQIVEEKLKEGLSKTLPLQQLASVKDDDSEMPSYVKFAIEAGMRTFSLGAFPVPEFPLSEPTADNQAATASPVDEDEKAVGDDEENVTDNDPLEEEADQDAPEDSDATSDLPKPNSALDSSAATTAAAASATGGAVASTTLATEHTELDLGSSDTNVTADNTEVMISKENVSEEDSAQKKSVAEVKPKSEITESEPKTAAHDSSLIAASTEPENKDDLETKMETAIEKEKEVPEKKTSVEEEKKESKSGKKESSTVIKNQSGLQPMLKMLGVSFIVFLITVGVGVGVGQGFIYLSQNNGGDGGTPEATTEPTPTPEATPTPTPEPDINVEELSILVVNATTKAGYAGTMKTKLEDANFGKVAAGNAKGEYEDGIIVLMEEENAQLMPLLAEALDEDLTFSDKIAVEDAKGEYDAVIVLAE